MLAAPHSHNLLNVTAGPIPSYRFHTGVLLRMREPNLFVAVSAVPGRVASIVLHMAEYARYLNGVLPQIGNNILY